MLTLTGCATDLPQTIPTSIQLDHETTIPMDLSYGVPIVEVFINHQGPFRVAIVTRTNGFNLDKKIAAQLQLPQSPYRGTYVGADSQGFKQAGFRRIEQLRIGDAILNSFDTIVEELNPQLRRIQIHAYAGYNFFSKANLTLDYPNAQTTLKPYQPLNPKTPGVITTRAAYSSGLVIPIIFNGQSHPFEVDTSFTLPFLLQPKTAELADFVSPPFSYESEAHHNQFAAFKIARLNHNATLAGHTIEKPTIAINPGEPFLITHSRQMEGLWKKPSSVGYSILKHFSITLDQRSHLAHFQRNGTGPIQSPPLRIFITGVRSTIDEDTWLVGEKSFLKIPNSPFSQDKLPPLKNGDRITHVNNIPIKQLNYLNNLQIVTNADEATLTVQRGAQTLTMTAPIITLLP